MRLFIDKITNQTNLSVSSMKKKKTKTTEVCRIQQTRHNGTNRTTTHPATLCYNQL